MTPKLIAGYAELANKYLDQIPVENTGDFEVIVEALKSITESQQSHTVPESLKGRISDIRYFLENPDDYVEKKEHYQEFKNIILGRVAAKIREFAQLTDKEKDGYIADQKKIKEKRQENHTNMAQHQPPGINSEAHTISEQEMLAEQQRRFQVEQPHWIDISIPSSFRLPSRFFTGQQPSYEAQRRAAEARASGMDTNDNLPTLAEAMTYVINRHIDIEAQRSSQIFPPLDIGVGPNRSRQRNTAELGISYYQTTPDQETTAGQLYNQLLRNAERDRESERAQRNIDQERRIADQFREMLRNQAPEVERILRNQAPEVERILRNQAQEVERILRNASS